MGQNVTDKLPGFPKGGWVSKVVPSRYDAGTVYVTSDSHRIGDYETHIWVSNDFGATFHSLNGNLKGEGGQDADRRSAERRRAVRRHRDGDFRHARSRQELGAPQGEPAQRARGRDHAASARQRDARRRRTAAASGSSITSRRSRNTPRRRAARPTRSCSRSSPALQWKAFDDKNDEFWGNQFFVGENPPTEAVIQFYLKKPMTDVKLKITDAVGKSIRELPVTGNRLQAGIQATCWDFRVEGLPAAGGGAAGAGALAGRVGAGGGGAAGAGAGRGRRTRRGRAGARRRVAVGAAVVAAVGPRRSRSPVMGR